MSERYRPGRRAAPVRMLAAVAATVIASAGMVFVTATPAIACPIQICPTPPFPPPLPPPPTIPPLRWAVIGDSYTSGEGSGMGFYKTLPNGQVDWRHQSGYAPAALAFDYLEVARKPLSPSITVHSDEVPAGWGFDHIDFLASSGATTADLSNPQIDPADASVVRSAPQLDGVDPMTQLIYYGLGGNDAHFSQLFQTALSAYVTGHGAGAVAQSPGLWRVIQANAVQNKVNALLGLMPTVRDNIARTLADVWLKAPNAQLVVGLYPQGLRPVGNADIPMISGEALDAIYPFGNALNDAIRQGVAQFQADHPGSPTIRLFDPNTAGPGGTSVVAGHELGQPGSYFNPLTPNMVELYDAHLFHGLQESFHPNQFGDVAMGTALATFMATQFTDLFPNGPDFDRVHTDPHAYADNPTVDAQFEAWAQANLNQMCTAAASPTLCSSSSGGGGNDPTFDPTNGGYIDAGSAGAAIEAWLFQAWAYQQAQANGTDTGTTTGPTFWHYIQDPSGQWYYQWSGSDNVIHTEIMPSDFTPTGPLQSDPGVDDQSADPGDPGSSDPGEGDPGEGDPGEGDPGDPGAGDPGDGDPGAGDPGDGGGGDPGDGGGGGGDGGGGGSGDGGGDGGYGDGGGGGGGGGGCDDGTASDAMTNYSFTTPSGQVIMISPSGGEPCDPDEY